MRQDAVMEQVFGMVNQLLMKNSETRKRKLKMRTYKVRGQMYFFQVALNFRIGPRYFSVSEKCVIFVYFVAFRYNQSH